MKKIVILSVALASASTLLSARVYGAGGGFTVLSGEQRVAGSISGVDRSDAANTFSFAYDSGTVPWSGTGLSGDVGPCAAVSARSDVDALFAHVDAEGFGGYYGYHGYATASASGTWVFQPESSVLVIDRDLKLGVWLSVSFDLTDLSTGQTVYHFAGDGDDWLTSPGSFPGYPSSYQYVFIDPAHEYRLAMALTAAGNDDNPQGTVWVTVTPVPGAWVLGIIGVGVVKCLRRRRAIGLR